MVQKLYVTHLLIKEVKPDRHRTFRISTKEKRYRKELMPYKISVCDSLFWIWLF